jgi:hypothetical protein
VGELVAAALGHAEVGGPRLAAELEVVALRLAMAASRYRLVAELATLPPLGDRAALAGWCDRRGVRLVAEPPCLGDEPSTRAALALLLEQRPAHIPAESRDRPTLYLAPPEGVSCSRQCARCATRWRQDRDGRHACPSCHPGQPRPLDERLSDPREAMGPAYAWSHDLDRWALVGDEVEVVDHQSLVAERSSRLDLARAVWDHDRKLPAASPAEIGHRAAEIVRASSRGLNRG